MLDNYYRIKGLCTVLQILHLYMTGHYLVTLQNCISVLEMDCTNFGMTNIESKTQVNVIEIWDGVNTIGEI